jgi:CheY-like chemotaxis protein
MIAKLGGYIGVQSEPGQGSAFTLYLPVKAGGEALPTPIVQPAAPRRPPALPPIQPPPPPVAPPSSASVADDRDQLAAGGRLLLIVEDDQNFAGIVRDYAHKKGFQCLIANNGEASLELVKRYNPAAVILDLHLPGMSGWQVLDALKNNPDTRHIPVHIMSVEDKTLDAFKRGGMGFLTKPVSPENLEMAFQHIEEFISREIKSLLIVEDDVNLRHSVTKLLGGADVQISEAGSGQVALALLRSQHFDGMILDLSLPDMSGFALLDQIHNDETIPHCPIIIYTGKALTEEENRQLMKYADSVIVKGVKSPERLLDETALFLHRVVADMPADKQQAIKQLYNREAQLAGKKVLIVDDDMRNSYAVSKLLGDKGMLTEIASNGQKALDMLQSIGDIDLVLMDIMMPVMDGLETTRRIRALPQFRKLPILALTAKAMKGDREKCLEAGASDYLSKPLDADRLFSMLRVWLYQ